MDMIITLLGVPFIYGFFWYLIQIEKRYEKKKKKERIDQSLKMPSNGIWSTPPKSKYELRAKKKGNYSPVYLEEEKKSNLSRYLEKYGKELARNFEQDQFIIPMEQCEEVIEELISWLNKLPNVDYALKEQDGIHVQKKKVV